MNDEETVALIVGGHTFGKCHGAASAGRTSAPSPRAARVEQQGLGWKNTLRHRRRAPTRSPAASRARGRNNPTQWDNGFLDNLFGYEWELTESPAGAQAVDADGPEAQDAGARRARPVEARTRR